MIVKRLGCLAALAFLMLAGLIAPAPAQSLNPLAEFDPARSFLKDKGQGLEIELALSQPVPYRILYLDNPLRLVVDFQEVNFDGRAAEGLGRSDRVRELHWGRFRPGWSRLVAVTDIPLMLSRAEERRGPAGDSTIALHFLPTTPEAYAGLVVQGAGDNAVPGAQAPAVLGEPIARQRGDRPLRIVLDAGHGGIDPGAEAGEAREAPVVLAFTLELAEILRRAGMTVELTRDSDIFVPLETRISVARAVRADVFLSLHADALEEGEATGATVYRLDAGASDDAARRLAERHDRADILAGLDLSGQDDEVAGVLMDLARQETGPRADRLAALLADRMKADGIKMHRHPIQSADFSVLKSADVPSLLMEIGFLSSKKDRERMADPAWRATVQQAILAALTDWAVADAAEANLIRQ